MGETDILIIGGGPTGTTLALELAAQEIPFRIIDKEAARSEHSPALAIQPRTQELLGRHGSIAKLVERGHYASSASFILNKKTVADVDLTSLADNTQTEFPMLLMVPQRETERYLDEKLADYGFSVERGIEASNVKQDADGVIVTLKKAGGVEETVKAKYVVGCDGRSSAVRAASSKFTFQGGDYPQDFIMADVRIKWEHPADKIFFCFGKGLLAIFPLGSGIFRLIVSRADVPFGKRTNDPTLKDFQEFVPKLLPGNVELSDASWLTHFRLTHRLVNHYRDGRLLVAGDAAHAQSPVGGQGMNTGIQDAVNLGWKLAAVVRGEKQASFLDSYDQERHRVGHHLVQSTDKIFNTATTSNPFVLLFRNFLLPRTLRSPSRRANMFRFITEFGINYRNSHIVSNPSKYIAKTMAGDRATNRTVKDAQDAEKWLYDLFDAESYHLLLFSGLGYWKASEVEMKGHAAKFLEKKPELMKVQTVTLFGDKPKGDGVLFDVKHELHRDYSFSTRPGYVLVRPDGYVARAGPLADLTGLVDWLKN
jgi:2-polyprenyl-6-methoxyphenol hydroxylase-like FAD-dependent oxidoreductase